MSDNKPASEQETSSANGPEPEIIDATVIEESPAPKGHDKENQAGESRKSGSFAAKAGWSLAALMVAFAGGVYLAPQFAPGLQALGIGIAPPPVAESRQTADLAPLQSELQTLNDTLVRHREILGQHEAELKAAHEENARLKNDLAVMASATTDRTDPADPAALADLQAEVGRLTDDVARLSTMTAEADPNVAQLSGALALARAEASQLKSRLAAVEQAMQAVQAGALESSPRGRLVLALGRLKDRAVTGQPFGPPLSALRPDFAALPAIDQQMIGADIAFLEANGAGIVPFETLMAEFDSVAAAAITAADKAEGGFLANLFSVRRTDAGATGIDATILQAERRLLARDVAGAVTALEQLEGPALEATAAWRTHAAAYAGVVVAFDRLTMRIAQAGSSPGEAGQ